MQTPLNITGMKDPFKYNKPEASSYDNNPQYYCNDEHMLDYDTPKVYVDRYIYVTNTFKSDSINKIVEIETEQNIDCNKLFQGKDKIFVINCYNIL